METHFRWLRLMVVLTIGEMERIKGRPKSGHPTLFLLDEFPGLKRMDVILERRRASGRVRREIRIYRSEFDPASRGI